MKFNNKQKEVLNNLLFVFLLFIFLIANTCISFKYSTSLFENLNIFLLLFAGIIYGFISENIVKSFLIGFLLWPVILFFRIVHDFSTVDALPALIVSYLRTGIIVLFLSMLWGFPGFFTARRNSTDGKKGIYRSLAFLSFLIAGIVCIFIFLD